MEHPFGATTMRFVLIRVTRTFNMPIYKHLNLQLYLATHLI